MAKPFKIPESVLVVIHSPQHEVLLIERADQPGAWQSVTGSRHHLLEPLATTAVREVAEETGIVVGSGAVPHGALRDWQLRNVYEIYPVWRHRYAEGVTHNTEHVFGLELAGPLPVALAADEHVAYCWLPWREAAAKCFSWSNRDAILMLGENAS